jgi:hypothetical protein
MCDFPDMAEGIFDFPDMAEAIFDFPDMVEARSSLEKREKERGGRKEKRRFSFQI